MVLCIFLLNSYASLRYPWSRTSKHNTKCGRISPFNHNWSKSKFQVVVVIHKRLFRLAVINQDGKNKLQFR